MMHRLAGRIVGSDPGCRNHLESGRSCLVLGMHHRIAGGLVQIVLDYDASSHSYRHTYWTRDRQIPQWQPTMLTDRTMSVAMCHSRAEVVRTCFPLLRSGLHNRLGCSCIDLGTVQQG